MSAQATPSRTTRRPGIRRGKPGRYNHSASVVCMCCRRLTSRHGRCGSDCLLSSDAVAVAVAAEVRAKVEQQPKPQPNPLQAHDASWKDDKIRQGRPRHENAAYQRPDPVGPGELERPGPRAEGESEARCIHQPPDHKKDPWAKHEQDGDVTAYVFLLCSGSVSRLARNDPAVKPLHSHLMSNPTVMLDFPEVCGQRAQTTICAGPAIRPSPAPRAYLHVTAGSELQAVRDRRDDH